MLDHTLSSGFLHFVTTISDHSRPQLFPGIRSDKLWCQARALLLLVPLVGKMSAFKLICYFSHHPAPFGFWVSLPPDNLTLNPAYKKTD